MDTGSSDLWLRARSFSPEASLTARRSGWHSSITYGQGSISGDVVEDTVRIGDAHVAGQSLMVVASGLDEVVSDGVLGLAMPGLSHTGATMLQNLQSQDGITIFSLLLSGPDGQSSMVLGLPDPSWYQASTLTWVPAVTGLWWAFEANLVVGGRTRASGNFLLDSGTSYLAAPGPAYRQLVADILPAEEFKRCRVQSTGVFVCPCAVADRAQSLEVLVGGQAYPVLPSDFLTPLDIWGRSCVLEVQQLQDGMPFILGDTFLRTVAAVFDSSGQRIGLARRRGASDREPPAGPLPPTLPPPAPSETVAAAMFLGGLGAAAAFGAALALLLPFMRRCCARRASGRTGDSAAGLLEASAAAEPAAPYQRI